MKINDLLITNKFVIFNTNMLIISIQTIKEGILPPIIAASFRYTLKGVDSF